MPQFAFEPETAAFVRSVEQGPPTEGLSIDDLRAGYRATVIGNSAVTEAIVAAEDVDIDRAGSAMPARLYKPDGAAVPGPLLIYVHGGGFAVGDLESHDRLIRLIAAEAGLCVLAIDYPRAPEHPFPAARDAAVAAFAWARAHASSIGIDPDRIAIGGESAGATHALMAALALNGAGGAAPAMLWLLVPATDPSGSGASHRDFATGAGRTAVEFAYLWSLYLPDEAQRRDAAIVPLLADPAGLPPIFLHAAEFDPARDDGEAFAAKAQAADVPVTVTRHAGLVHQFPEITGISPASRAAVTDAAHQLGKALRGD